MSDGRLMSEETCGLIKNLLASQGIRFKEVHHQATHTSEESARARGEDISIGGKAILMKVEDEYKLFVLSAAKRIDSQKIKRHFNARRIRFATTDELQQLTGLVPGSVPPFGKPVLPFHLYVDESIISNEKIAFNAGLLTTSIIMSRSDYIRIASPEIFEFSS
jgi:Ala-tRNA(Pro) deacylase